MKAHQKAGVSKKEYELGKERAKFISALLMGHSALYLSSFTGEYRLDGRGDALPLWMLTLIQRHITLVAMNRRKPGVCQKFVAQR